MCFGQMCQRKHLGFLAGAHLLRDLQRLLERRGRFVPPLRGQLGKPECVVRVYPCHLVAELFRDVDTAAGVQERRLGIAENRRPPAVIAGAGIHQDLMRLFPGDGDHALETAHGFGPASRVAEQVGPQL